MTRTRRIAFEILSPPLIATFLMATDGRSPDTLLIKIFGFPVMLFYAYVFGIIPSVVYALVMETWIRLKGHQKFGVFLTVLISSLLGLLSGYAVFFLSRPLTQGSSADLKWLMGIGIQTGVSAGFLIAWCLQTLKPK